MLDSVSQAWGAWILQQGKIDLVAPSPITIGGKPRGKNQKAKANHAGTKWLVEISEQGLRSQRLSGWKKEKRLLQKRKGKNQEEQVEAQGAKSARQKLTRLSDAVPDVFYFRLFCLQPMAGF